ncbi:recombinase zinc beta ribbon domain-containing protein [Paracoccus angustae]|uniref:Recombinase zinc beta ribbon domain-containing protein n=1 Tax=Paracoccus angustae TaxID=1671480 RepID=A0ABV7U363_9RHOB
MDGILADWSVATAKLALDEIQNRLKLIGELHEKLRDERADEVRELQPLIERSLWVFGPEFESIEFTSNRGMSEVIRRLLGGTAQGSLNRPDFVILPDGSVGLFARPAFDEQHEVIGVEHLIVVELKRPGIPIGMDQKNQAWKYVVELQTHGLIDDSTRVTCFVLGSRLTPREGVREEGRTKIIPMAYETFIRRAETRMLNLYARLSEAPFLRQAGLDVSSGPTLLTGICFCAKCGGAMTLRTGQGSTGATYRYYTCSTKARQGKTGCKGRTIPMDKLDHLVADHIGDRLLQPKRLETVLASVIDRRQERAERRREYLAELNRRITDADQRLGRLFDAIEAGMVDKDDAMAKERMASLKALRDQAAADAERTQLALDSSGNQGISPDMLKGFALKARERIRLDDGGYRRDHLRALAQRVEVADDEVRIMGSKSELLRTLVAGSSVETAAFGVHSSVLKWRTRRDSNPWPLPSEGLRLAPSITERGTP